MYDFGYDITDYRKIAPEYGTMEDFKNLLKRAKILGIYYHKIYFLIIKIQVFVFNNDMIKYKLFF